MTTQELNRICMLERRRAGRAGRAERRQAAYTDRGVNLENPDP